MWKFEAITQGFDWPRLSSGIQPVTCIEDKGGNASPGFWQRDAAMRGRQQRGEADGGDEAAA